MIETTAADQPTVLDHLLAAEREALTQRALAMLGDSEREAVVLYYRGDESLPEVAAALGITTEAAKKRVQRGRTHLRDALASVEASLRASRPGAAFTAGCVAALAVAGAKSASAATTTGIALKLAIAGAAVVALGVGAYAVTRGSSSSTSDERAPAIATASGSAEMTPALGSPRLAAARAKQLAAAGVPATKTTTATTASAPAAAASSTVFPELPAADRVYDFAGSSLATPLPPLGELPASPLDKRQLRALIAQAQPQIQDCVAKSGETRKATLELVVRLETVFDSTVATHARVDGVLASNQALVGCVQDALLSISFPGIADGDVIDVAYPFTL